MLSRWALPGLFAQKMQHSLSTPTVVVLLWLPIASTFTITSTLQRVGGIALHEGSQLATTNCMHLDSTGQRIWDAGRVLASVLCHADLNGKRVLELGSGTGVGGLTAAKGGAALVMLTDGSETAVELLQQNIKANNLEDSAQSYQLSWGYLADTVDLVAHGPWDLIIGSDLLYAPESHPDLLTTLAALCTPSHTEVLLTYPTRFTESLFFDEAAELFRVDDHEEVEPALWATRMVMRA